MTSNKPKTADDIKFELQEKLEEMAEDEVRELHPETDITFRHITEEMSFDEYE